jgi:MFS family permease
MYKIIGADGREYGPVSAAQLRQWIVEGRANSQTRVQQENSAEWILLGSLPEFADACATTAPPPPIAVAEAQQQAKEILLQDYRITIGDCIGRAFDLIRRDFWFLVGASVIAGLIAGGGVILPYLSGLISLIIYGPMMGGLNVLYLRKIRGQAATFGDIFLGFGVSFGSLLGAHLICTLLTMVGFLFCLIPGIYLAVSWIFTIPLVIDKRLGFWEAMELSRKVVTKHWWKMFGLVLVFFLLGIAGLLVCIVGVFIAGAVCQIALLYAYEDIFHPRPGPTVVIP